VVVAGGERTLSDSVVMREDYQAEHSDGYYVRPARSFAEREARAAGLID
jgi:hypothetical protein